MAINYSNPADIFGLQKQNVGVRAASPQNNLQPTSNTLGKGFVEPYQPVPAVKSTSGGTTGQYNISTPTGPSYAPPPSLAAGTGINYQMTPQEASSGQAGITAYNARIAGARGTTTPNSQSSGGSTTPGTPPVTSPSVTPTTPSPVPTYPAPQTFDPNQQGLYGALIAQLANRAQQPTPDYTAAQQQAQQYNQALQQSRTNEAQGLAANAQNPIPLEFQQGRGQVLQSQYAQEQAALGAGFQGASNLLGAANTQQQLQQAGLLGAAGLAAPQPYGVESIPYNPATGQFGGVAGIAATGGTGATGLQGIGNLRGQIAIGQDVALQNSYLGGAQVVGKNLQDLISTQNINPSDVTFLNSINQYLQTGVLSNPQYQKFTGQINDFINSLAPILGAGGSATDLKTQMSAQIVNAAAKGGSINDVVGYFLDQAKQKILGRSIGGGAGIGQSSNDPLGIR